MKGWAGLLLVLMGFGGVIGGALVHDMTAIWIGIVIEFIGFVLIDLEEVEEEQP